MTSFPEATRLSRRAVLTGAAAAAGALASGGLTACGPGDKTNAPGTTGADALKRALPKYIPSTSVTPDIPSVTGATGAASDPAFLSYPATPAQTVAARPGSGGVFSTRTPLWGAIPPSSGNTYYDAVNAALGSTMTMQPADGNTYVDTLPALFAAGKLPDWLQIPSWGNQKLNLGTAVEQFVDLTPYLSGDNVAQYPNLANIPSAAWQAGVWNGKLYGIPSFSSPNNFPGYLFYRKDLLEAAGVSPDVKSADDLFAAGKQLTNANAGRWAFDDLWPFLLFPYGVVSTWNPGPDGKLVHQYETDGIVEAMSFAARLAKAGYVHPDALAGNTGNGQQRFWSGKVAIGAGGTGAMDGDDHKGGTAANPAYSRQLVKVFSATGGTPQIQLGPGAGWFSYLNRKLSDKQIREALAIANFLAAPYGSKEYLLVNFGAADVDHTMTGGNPVLTQQGSKDVATSYQFLASGPQVSLVKNGFTQVVKDYAAWQADAVKHAVRPMFFAMNVTEPAQYASIGQQVEDTIKDVRSGRKSIDDYRAAVAAWRKQGGDDLRKFYEGVREKHGTGQ
ncbi:putative aldouronate transport system substrate-binding protein [Hamadaea flava]|uniref:ABC transporter substrate-binding protein n=1 Tax=Hamadaea flava TaxID=1742688 RepID=A0ABV8LMX7_9ACTN|nr:extracellular solute-binding protein [Hamadaea flava]MCP2323023.1 putative aldouronate transport system substrate-binding protein [Hamadaea flava]